MRISTLLYTLKQGFVNIFRNKVFSLASIATISACIFLFGLFYSVIINFQNIVKAAQTNVAVTVFFDEGISDDEITGIGDMIRARGEVSEVKFISADEAWESYKEDYLAGYEDTFGEDNPLEELASYAVYLNDVSMQKSLVTYIESIDGVRSVKKSEVVAMTLTNVNLLVGYVSVGIIAILLAVSIFLISNTVAIGITVRREEIAIMKLIGATDFVVRSPFVIEGIIIGVIGSALPLLVVYLLYNRVVLYVMEQFAVLSDLLQFLTVQQVFSTLIPVAIAMGVGIGFLGSFSTVRKHLKV